MPIWISFPQPFQLPLRVREEHHSNNPMTTQSGQVTGFEETCIASKGGLQSE